MKLTLRATDAIMRDRGIQSGGDVQKHIDSEVLRLSDTYVPLDTDDLKKSGQRATEIGSGIVQYNTPYARYQYYGRVMVGTAPKQVTNIPLTYQGAPKRGKLWFERMKADHKTAILQGARKKAGAT